MSDDFEGSIVLEKLADLDLVEDFLEAVDADDFQKVATLLRRARVEDEMIKEVLEQMQS